MKKHKVIVTVVEVTREYEGIIEANDMDEARELIRWEIGDALKCVDVNIVEMITDVYIKEVDDVDK